MSTHLSIGGRADEIRRMQEAVFEPAEINVGARERIFSDIGGIALLGFGLKRGGLGGGIMALLGAGLLYRGITGHCELYKALNLNTAAKPSVEEAPDIHHGVKVEKTVTIQCTPAECYAAFRDFENLPRFMTHLVSIKWKGGDVYHWTVKAPLGGTVSWNAEIIKDVPGSLISWRSLNDAMISNAGSVRFEPTADGLGTAMTVAINYEPPAGLVGVAIAKLVGEEPENQLIDELMHFKHVMETDRLARL